MYPVSYSEVLGEKALRFGRAYDESSLKRAFVEGLHESIRASMRIYWGAHKDAIFQNLMRYITSLSMVPEEIESRTTLGNDHVDTGERQRPFTAYTIEGEDGSSYEY